MHAVKDLIHDLPREGRHDRGPVKVMQHREQVLGTTRGRRAETRELVEGGKDDEVAREGCGVDVNLRSVSSSCIHFNDLGRLTTAKWTSMLEGIVLGFEEEAEGPATGAEVPFCSLVFGFFLPFRDLTPAGRSKLARSCPMSNRDA